jgi:ABC-type Na+ transport system ATPase subunit NatA
VLELRDLARRYGDVVALDGVSFTVDAGQMFGFVGPNGAGKTTTMRIILGVLAADRGDVLFRGAPVDFETRRRFGYMPEERGLYPKMRVRDQLVYLARLHGRDAGHARDAAERWIGQLGLTERAGDRVEQLSLGNQQRVQLAAALVHDPELLVLDEPFSGLDPVGVDVLSGVLSDYAGAACRSSSPRTSSSWSSACARRWRSSRTAGSWPRAAWRSCATAAQTGGASASRCRAPATTGCHRALRSSTGGRAAYWSPSTASVPTPCSTPLAALGR